MFPWQREVCHLRFLKPALRARLNPERYLRDRLHEALDRLPHSPEGDADFAAFGLRAAYLLPALASKTTALLAARGVRAEMPFVNEAVAARLWGAGEARAHFLAGKRRSSLVGTRLGRCARKSRGCWPTRGAGSCADRRCCRARQCLRRKPGRGGAVVSSEGERVDGADGGGSGGIKGRRTAPVRPRGGVGTESEKKPPSSHAKWRRDWLRGF